MTLLNLTSIWENKTISWPKYIAKIEKYKTERRDCDKLLKSNEHNNKEKIDFFRTTYKHEIASLFAGIKSTLFECIKYCF